MYEVRVWARGCHTHIMAGRREEEEQPGMESLQTEEIKVFPPGRYARDYLNQTWHVWHGRELCLRTTSRQTRLLGGVDAKKL